MRKLLEVQLNNSVSVRKVLLSAEGWIPPTIKFHFVGSALQLSEF